MKKLVIGSAIALSAFCFGVGSASAATPAVQGCVGASVSTNARTVYHPYGTFVSSLRPTNFYGSLGDALQALQAGAVPNGVGFDNTCNGS
jgi:hypothetical protein